jgi:hypothetical protein
VLAFHHREAAKQRAHGVVGGIDGGTLVERATAELDLESRANGGERSAMRTRVAAGLAWGQLATANRASPIGEREALAGGTALPAMPLAARTCAADRFRLVGGSRL